MQSGRKEGQESARWANSELGPERSTSRVREPLGGDGELVPGR